MQISTGSLYHGPIPHPSIMKGYKDIDPTFPERIMKQFEANSEHIRIMEREAQRADISRDIRGQWMAYSLTIVLIFIFLWSIHRGYYIIGGASGLLCLGWIVKSFNVNSKK